MVEVTRMAVVPGKINNLRWNWPVRMELTTPDGFSLETIIPANSVVKIFIPVDTRNSMTINFNIEDELKPTGPTLVKS